MLQQFLYAVPPWVFALIFVAVIFGGVFIPRKLLLATALIVTPPVLLTNQFTEVAMLQAASKLSTPLVYCVLLIAALQHPGRRIKVPAVGWCFVIFSILGVIVVSRCIDASKEMMINGAYFLMTLAVLAVVSVVDSPRMLMYVLRSTYVGLCLCVLILFAGLLLDPRSLELAGVRRFSPWGSNPDMFSMLPSIGLTSSLVAIRMSRNLVFRVFVIGIAALSFGEVAATGSRAAMIVSVLTGAPILLQILKNPISVAIVIGGCAGVLQLVMVGLDKGLDLSRFSSLETSRWEIAWTYFLAFLQRPMLGVFEQPYLSANFVEEASTHSHNSYLLILYRGGIIYFTFYLIPMIIFVPACFKLFRQGTRLGIDPAIVNYMIAVAVSAYAHGLVNQTNIWGTSYWAMLHMLLVVLIVSITGNAWKALQPGVHSYAPASPPMQLREAV